MRWAKAVALLGSALVLVSFWIGTDTPVSVRAGGASYACDDVFTSAMLISGQPGSDHVTDGRTRAERALDALVVARCAPLERRSRWLVWSGMGLGTAALLVGWTALREREREMGSPSGAALVPIDR